MILELFEMFFGGIWAFIRWIGRCIAWIFANLGEVLCAIFEGLGDMAGSLGDSIGDIGGDFGGGFD